MNRDHLTDIFNQAVSAVDPYESVVKAIRVENDKLFAAGTIYPLDVFERIIVAGAGKAALRMAHAAEAVLGHRITDGVVIAPYGSTGALQKIEIAEASHPLPDDAGVLKTQKILELARDADEKTVVICLLSGGGSALLVAPVKGVTLDDKKRVTGLLLRSGCTIAELNAVRKHLSSVKGGRLAKAACPASVVSLILSDVVGDNLDVIASGPTVPDSSTFAEAARVLEKYRLKAHLPAGIGAYLERGAAGREPETAKSGDGCFIKTRNMVVGGIAQALFAARSRAKALGYGATLVTCEVQGRARDVARSLAKTVLAAHNELRPGERRCLLFGGETTVSVTGNGKGGRNQELALAFAREISGLPGISLLSAGTDGADGPTDAAGAVVDGTTVQKAMQLGIIPDAYLANNDSYSFFRQIDFITREQHLLITGPTGTNVMDMQIVLLEG